jgi:hypothetical protein
MSSAAHRSPFDAADADPFALDLGEGLTITGPVPCASCERPIQLTIGWDEDGTPWVQVHARDATVLLSPGDWRVRCHRCPAWAHRPPDSVLDRISGG